MGRPGRRGGRKASKSRIHLRNRLAILRLLTQCEEFNGAEIKEEHLQGYPHPLFLHDQHLRSRLVVLVNRLCPETHPTESPTDADGVWPYVALFTQQTIPSSLASSLGFVHLQVMALESLLAVACSSTDGLAEFLGLAGSLDFDDRMLLPHPPGLPPCTNPARKRLPTSPQAPSCSKKVRLVSPPTNALVVATPTPTKETDQTKTNCKQFIASLQDMDRECHSLQNILDLSLIVDVPREVLPGQPRNRTSVDLSCQHQYHRHYQRVYDIPRYPLMAYLCQYLCRMDHYTLGENGKEALRRHGRTIHTLGPQRNWPYSPKEPYRPICIFKKEGFFFEGRPFLSTLEEQWQQLVPLLPTLMRSEMKVSARKKKDKEVKRGTVLCSYGYTNLEATAWVTTPLRREPGLSTKTLRLHPKLRQWFGNMVILMSHGISTAVQGRHPTLKFFGYSAVERQLLYKLGRFLQVPEDRLDQVQVPSFSIAWAPVEEGTLTHLDWHKDVNNDYADGRQWLCQGSIIFDQDTFPTKVKQWLQNNGCTFRYMSFQFMAYTRLFLRQSAEKLSVFLSDDDDPGFIILREVVSNTDLQFEYHSFLEDSQRFSQFLQDNREDGSKGGQHWKGYYWKYGACCHRVSYLSSFLDVWFDFVLKYQPTYQMWLDNWLVIGKETNGQMLYYTILSKWVRGDFLQGKNNFRRKLNEIHCLYKMYCMEVLRVPLAGNAECGENKRGSTTTPRYQKSSDIEWYTKHTISMAPSKIPIIFGHAS